MRWREKGDGVMNGGSEGEIGTERAEREMINVEFER